MTRRKERKTQRRVQAYDILVEEWLHANDLFSGVQKASEDREHTLIGACCDNDFRFRIQTASEQRTIRVCQGLAEPKSTTRMTVLIGIVTIHRLASSLTYEIRRKKARRAIRVNEEMLARRERGERTRPCFIKPCPRLMALTSAASGVNMDQT